MKLTKALLLLFALVATMNAFSQCSICSTPAAPAEYGGALGVTQFKGTVLQLWAATPSVAVCERDWYKVVGTDTTSLGTGDTLSVVTDTTCKYIARNKNTCSGTNYYSAYVVMASITVVGGTAPASTVSVSSATICSGTPTDILLTATGGTGFTYLRGDTSHVSGSVSGISTSGPLSITLTNNTGSSQVVRILVRSYNTSTFYYSDNKIIYVTVLPSTAPSGNHCFAPVHPNPVFMPNPSFVAAKGATLQLMADTTVVADSVQWYKVVGTDTTYAGQGYYINVTADTTCTYLAQSENVCNCSTGSVYYSALTQMTNFSVSSSYTPKNLRLGHYMDTIASGTQMDVYPLIDSGSFDYFALYRDNAYVTGSTSAGTGGANASIFGFTLTNTTSVPQRVRYKFMSNVNSSGLCYGNMVTGYVVVLPSTATAPTGNHCIAPAMTNASLTHGNILYCIKGAVVNLDLGNKFGISNLVADSLDWYKVRWPGDTTYLGNSYPINATMDTPCGIFTISKNVCYWSDSSKHIYRSGLAQIANIVVSTATDPTISLTNNSLYLCNGLPTNIHVSNAYGQPIGWVRDNTWLSGSAPKVAGRLSGTINSPYTVLLTDTLTDTVTAPQQVHFEAYASVSGYRGSSALTTVTVYPPCSTWANNTIAIHPAVDSICSWDTATLTADTLPCNGGTRYVWSSGDTTRSIRKTASGTYTVTATNACGCSATASSTVVVRSNPSPTVNSPSICSGASTTMTATGGVHYHWNNGDTTANFTTSSAGTYTVTATNSYGCSASASGTLTVNSNPTPAVNSDTICSGATATLTATGGTSYLWSTSATTASITTSTSGTYSVTVTNAAGCTATTSGTVVVNSTPSPTVNNDTVCLGEAASLIATGGISYTWANGETTSTISTFMGGVYAVTVTNGFGCSSIDSGTVVTNEIPNVTVSNAYISIGDTGIITATGGISYLWSTGDTTATIRSSTPGTYSVTATASDGCKNVSSGVIAKSSVLSFELNKGQFHNDTIKYLAQASNILYRFLSNGVSFAKITNDTLTDTTHVLVWNMSLGNMNPSSYIIGDSAGWIRTTDSVSTSYYSNTGTINYYIGQDSSGWHSNIPTFDTLIYKDVYNNIDLKYYGVNNTGNLEYDYIINPGGNLTNVKMHYSGVDSIYIDSLGNVNIDTHMGEVMEMKPVAYQYISGIKANIPAIFTIDSIGDIGFAITGSYDSTQPLVIDPFIQVWSTYWVRTDDANSSNVVTSMAADQTGVYIGGTVFASYLAQIRGDYPISSGIFDIAFNQTTFNNQANLNLAFVAKFATDASHRIFTTIFGGISAPAPSSSPDATVVPIDEVNQVFDLKIDQHGNVYSCGATMVSDFPSANIVGGIPYLNPGGAGPNSFGDAFLGVFGRRGQLIYLNTFGGSNNDVALKLTLDDPSSSTPIVYLTGFTESSDFLSSGWSSSLTYPVSTSQTNQDIFMVGIDAWNSPTNFYTGLVWGSNSGASTLNADWGRDIMFSNNKLFVTGFVGASTGFPVVNSIGGPAPATPSGTSRDGFITELTPISGQVATIDYSSSIGGKDADDEIFCIDHDLNGSIYLLGMTGQGLPNTNTAIGFLAPGYTSSGNLLRPSSGVIGQNPIPWSYQATILNCGLIDGVAYLGNNLTSGFLLKLNLSNSNPTVFTYVDYEIAGGLAGAPACSGGSVASGGITPVVLLSSIASSPNLAPSNQDCWGGLSIGQVTGNVYITSLYSNPMNGTECAQQGLYQHGHLFAITNDFSSTKFSTSFGSNWASNGSGHANTIDDNNYTRPFVIETGSVGNPNIDMYLSYNTMSPTSGDIFNEVLTVASQGTWTAGASSVSLKTSYRPQAIASISIPVCLHSGVYSQDPIIFDVPSVTGIGNFSNIIMDWTFNGVQLTSNGTLNINAPTYSLTYDAVNHFYQIIPGSTNLPNTGTGNPNSYILTITYQDPNNSTNACVLGTYSFDVIVTSNQTTSITSPSLCAGPGITLTVSPPPSTSSYQWSQNGTILSGVNTPTYTPTAFGTYSVTTTASNGCTATAVIYSCCSASGDIYNSADSLNPQDLSMINFASGHNIVINGYWRVNSSITISSVPNVYMGPQAYIGVTSSGMLDVNNSVLQGCSYMWQGIDVANNGSVTIENGSTIADAETAVTRRGNGNFKLNSSHFYRNNLSVFMYAGSQPFYTGSGGNGINNCDFIYNTTTSGTYPLLAPYAGMRPEAAIIMAQNSNIIIGDDFTVSPNTFDGLNSGIVNLWATLTVNNNIFRNIHNYNGTTNIYDGVAVYADGGDLFDDGSTQGTDAPTTVMTSQTIPTSAPSSSAAFSNNDIAIRSDWATLTVQNNAIAGNSFTSVLDNKVGVYTQNVLNRNIQVINNYMDNIDVGVSLLTNTDATVFISGNTINVNPTQGNPYSILSLGYKCTYGIYETELFPDFLNSNISIMDNSITGGLDNIYLNNTSGINIGFITHPNHFSLPDNTSVVGARNGIYASDCLGLKILDNTFVGNGGVYDDGLFGASSPYVTTSDAYQVRGIGFSNTGSYSDICSNTFTNIGYAMYFEADCDQTHIASANSNTINETKFGVFLHDLSGADGLIGPQADGTALLAGVPTACHQGIAFTGPFDNSPNTYQTFTYNSDGSNSPFYVYGTSGPSSNGTNGSLTTAIQTNPGGAAAHECSYTFSRSNFSIATALGDISAYNHGSYSDGELWIAQHHLFNQIIKDTALLNSDTTYQNFYNSLKNGDFGILSQIEQNLSAMAMTMDTTTKDSLLTIAKGLNGKLSLATVFCSSIFSINDIYLRTIAQRKAIKDTNDLSLIWTLAHSCPLVYGDAVYSARSLCSQYFPLESFDDGILCTATESDSSKRHHKSIVIDSVYARVIPNPAINIATVYYSTSANMTNRIELYNNIGEMVFTTQLAQNSGKIELNISAYPSGVYMLRFLSDEKAILNTKLVIIKQ